MIECNRIRWYQTSIYRTSDTPSIWSIGAT